MTKKLIIIMLAVLFGANVFADITISDVKVFSGYPWKEVILGYRITGTTDKPLTLLVKAKDMESGKTYVCETLEGVSIEEGVHAIKWNAEADCAKFKSDRVVFTMQLINRMRYCIIDLSGGTNTTSYAVTYQDDPLPEGWQDIDSWKTKLVLRRIESGSFDMQGQSRVTLTKPFYIGVRLVSERQYNLVMNGINGGSDSSTGFSWAAIRGSSAVYDWPTVKAVDPCSFIGRIRAKTGLNLDLPTEAQWEYVSRAGQFSVYEGTVEPNACGRRDWDYQRLLNELSPNNWGIYHMYGGFEWCLDWYGSISESSDPVGPSYGTGRVLRSSRWYSSFSEDTEYRRVRQLNPRSEIIYSCNFRIVRMIEGVQ